MIARLPRATVPFRLLTYVTAVTVLRYCRPLIVSTLAIDVCVPGSIHRGASGLICRRQPHGQLQSTLNVSLATGLRDLPLVNFK